MKAVKVLRKLLIAVLVMTAFLICVYKLKNSRKFNNILEFKKEECAMKKELKDETTEKAPGFSKRKYITIR